MSTTAEDPSQWFAKFHPTYFFDNPKQAQHGSGSWLVLAEQEVEFSEEMFWKVIDRWTNEAHLVIPPLSSVEIVSETTLETFDPTASTRTIVRRLIPKRKEKDCEMEERVEYFRDAEVSRVVYTPMLEQAPDNSDPAALLPFYYPKVKSFGYSYIESGIGNSRESHQSLIRLEILPFPSTDHFLPTDKMRYALTQLFHKLYKWCVAEVVGYCKRVHHDIMVPKETYMATYAKLKDKYVEKWVRDWPEKTDPRKFVFEDIAIASFLISLWEMDRDEMYSDRKPAFVDLGCGNGLLTHILTCEGYDGVGIDLARRKVWNAFEAEEVGTRLVAETLHPPTARYPEADWLIGNHADELVPCWDRLGPVLNFVLDVLPRHLAGFPLSLLDQVCRNPLLFPLPQRRQAPFRRHRDGTRQIPRVCRLHPRPGVTVRVQGRGGKLKDSEHQERDGGGEEEVADAGGGGKGDWEYRGESGHVRGKGIGSGERGEEKG
ncbi:hypothetical protein BC937DRAFT_91661 [Endogone sp. FLAS-F59071]|nr:hypothetical protein BC937DRAFT_91661 [Endogone sp. FLAS-F59071]|eukprot:RUS23177.1 hypothetical protein BC937DRAFT_91661 [Endogone sp. FLAS-F59071]